MWWYWCGVAAGLLLPLASASRVVELTEAEHASVVAKVQRVSHCPLPSHGSIASTISCNVSSYASRAAPFLCASALAPGRAR
jgi:hypothetical protein